MRISTAARPWSILLCALVVAPAAHAAEETPPSVAAPEPTRREVVLALGYGSLIAPGGVVVMRGTDNTVRTPGFDGFSIDVTRRISRFEYGARFWRMGSSSDGQGSSAHALTRVSSEARVYPWNFSIVEPWIGTELGLAIADDFAIWNATDKEPAHRAVADVRPGVVAGLEVGARFRLASVVALGARGGLLYLGFDRARGPVADPPASTKFFVQPTDYGRRLWLSVAFTAELTVPD